MPAVTTANAIRTAAANAGNLERDNQQQAARGQPEASAWDVWSHTADELGRRAAGDGSPQGNLGNALREGIMGTRAGASPSGALQGMEQQAGTIRDQFLDLIGEGSDPKKNPEGVLQNVGAFFGLLTSVEQLLSIPFGMISFPAFPALRILDMDVGLPHAHAHPPNLPPPPPIPLPSTGPVIPIPILSGAMRTLINGMPAARCGDMGLGIWCGGYFPMFEVFLGSANVWIEGARASRMAVDITNHCIFTVRPRAGDPPVGCFLGTTIMGSGNVLVGGVPMPSLTNLAMAAALRGLGKLIRRAQGTKLGQRFASRAHSLADNLMNALGISSQRWRNFIHRAICFMTGHPVDVATGKVLTEAVDFELPGPIPFRWERVWYSTSDYTGPVGHGWHHSYDLALLADDRAVAVRLADGRGAVFPPIEVGKEAFNAQESLTLIRDDQGYAIRTPEVFIYRFAPVGRSNGEHALAAVQDLSGNRIQFHYDKLGRLTRIVDSAGRTIRVTVDGDGRIAELIAPHPKREEQWVTVVRYEYSAQGDLVSASDAIHHARRYAYENHLLVRETDRNGFSFHFQYDGSSASARCVHTWGDGGLFDHKLIYGKNVTIREDSYGAVTAFYCNEFGLAEKIVDSLGRTRSFEYNELFRTVKETDGVGSSLVMEYDDRGNIIKISDADGVSRSYRYDKYDQEIQETIGDGVEFRHTYTQHEQLFESTNPLGGGFANDYSPQGRLRSIASRSGRKLFMEWDESGNPTALTLPGEDPVRSKYDLLGAQIELQLPHGETARYERDLVGRSTSVIGSMLGTYRLEYDGEGNVIRTTDPRGETVACQFGLFNRLLAVEDSVRGQRRFDYDREGELIAIVNENGERLEYVRDSEGQVTQLVDFSGRRTSFRYDAAGRISEITDHSEKKRTLQWTPGGRLKSVTYADGTFEKYRYDSFGRLVAAENESGKLQRAFDPIGRLIREVWNDFSLEHAYDVDDLRTHTRASDGTDIEYEYDAGGRLAGLKANGRWQWRRSYHTNGLPALTQLPGGHTEKRSYDQNGALFEQRVDRSAGGLLAGRQFDCNSSGEVAAIFDRQRGSAAFVYGRYGLTRVLRDGHEVERYSFDKSGNRLVVGVPNELGPGGRLLRQDNILYEYDADGRMIRKEAAGRVWQFEYNDRAQLTRAITPDGELVSFAYDPFGRRVKKCTSAGEVRWTWLGQSPLREQEVTAGREKTTHYLFEPDSFVPIGAVTDGAGFSFISDLLGTPQEVIGEDGSVVWAGEYSAWGSLRRSFARGFDNHLRFPGQFFDAETGLHYNYQRYYDPDTARFLTPDPIGISGGLNAYSYPNNPIAWADPLGLAAGCVRRFLSSYYVFLRSGIRPKHVRALMRVAMREGTELAFRNIRWWKRFQSMFAGMLGVPPKPMSVKGKVGPTGTVGNPRVRSDYDPTYYRKDGRTLSNDEALDMNRRINNEIGSEEIQHGTHNTMDQAGVPPDKVREIGPPGDSTVFHPDGTTSQVTNSDMIGDPSIPWHW